MTEGPFRIHVVDDDRAMRSALRDLFEAAGWHVDASSGVRDALRLLATEAADAVVSDVRMPAQSGLDLLAEIAKRAPPAPPVILLSAHGDIQMAVEALHAGAYTFFEKPFDPRRLVGAVRHAAEQHRLRLTADRLKRRLSRLSGLDRSLVGLSPEMTRLRDMVMDCVGIDAPVLITGETGTGKELVAHALHQLSDRSDAPFRPVNCATLKPEDVGAALFGEPEATVFLDEVGTCPPEVQAHLLRVIETEPKDGPRIVSATNTDLETAMAEGGFRQDLFFRLAAMRIPCPPLRNRGEDIVLLYQRFLADYAAAHGLVAPDLSADDAAVLLAHPWPGNVRELRTVALRHALALRRSEGASVQGCLNDDQGTEAPPHSLRDAVARFERQLIARALRANSGRMDETAEELGIGRRTLNEKMAKLGLARETLL